MAKTKGAKGSRLTQAEKQREERDRELRDEPKPRKSKKHYL